MSEAEREAEEALGVMLLAQETSVYELLQWLAKHNNLQYNFTRDGFDSYLRAKGDECGKTSA